MLQGSAAISWKKRGDVAVVMFNERRLIGKSHAVHANIELRHAARKAKGRVLLDLSNVEFISTVFIAVLIELSRTLRSSGGSLKICGVSPLLTGIMKLCSAVSTFEVYGTKREALEAFHVVPGHTLPAAAS
ncbi:MAG: STAS domain-containing protein [Planctomycetes bacterium]|nr:STAS domain-containing protein [Planctomycetota bacterium]